MIPSVSLVSRGLLLFLLFNLQGCQTTVRLSGSTDNDVVNGILTMSKPYRQTVVYALELSGNEQRLQLSSRLGVPVGEVIFLDGELETMRIGSRVLTPSRSRHSCVGCFPPIYLLAPFLPGSQVDPPFLKQW